MNLADRYTGIAPPEKLRHLREILDEAEKRQNEARRHERERAQSLSRSHITFPPPLCFLSPPYLQAIGIGFRE